MPQLSIDSITQFHLGKTPCLNVYLRFKVLVTSNSLMTSRDSQVIKCGITPNSEIIRSDKDSLEEMNGGLVLSM